MFNAFDLEGDRGARRDASSPEAPWAVCRSDPGKLMGHIITALLALRPGRRQIERQRVVPRLSSAQPRFSRPHLQVRWPAWRACCDRPVLLLLHLYLSRAVHKGGGE